MWKVNTKEKLEAMTLKQKRIIREVKNQKIPSPIIEYTENVFRNRVEGKFSKTLMRFPKRVIRDINKLIRDASIATNQSPEELIDSTDFNPSDLPSDRIEALFAELRTVTYLVSEGFKDVHFIKSERKKKRADLFARRNGMNYIIEVTCSSSAASKNNWQPLAIINYILRKLEGSQNKRLQLTETLKEYNADRMVLVVVLDTEDKNALNSSRDAMDIARLAWLRIKEKDLHICIIMGGPDIVYEMPPFLIKIMSKYGYIKVHPMWMNLLGKLICIFGKRIEAGSGNIVYPPWPN